MKEKKWCAASVCSPDLLILTSLHVRSAEETVHSKPTWFHEFILMKGITHFFLITSHFASRLWLLHRKNSIFQLTCTYLSTVNRKIHGVQHVSWLQGHRRAGKRRGHCPLSFRRGATWAEVPSWVISWFIKIDLKQIYCSYSRNTKIQNVFLWYLLLFVRSIFLLKRKKHTLFFYKFPLPSIFFTAAPALLFWRLPGWLI